MADLLLGPASSPVFAQSRTRWLHRPVPEGRQRRGLSPDGRFGSADVVAWWLAEMGGRHRVEVRLAAHGPHAGAWFGVAGIGATPREAETIGARAATELGEAFRGAGWDVLQVGEAPPLPEAAVALAGFGPPQRLAAGDDFQGTRWELARMAEAGNDLVVVVGVDLAEARPYLVRQAVQIQQVAWARSVIHHDGGWHQAPCDAETWLEASEKILDEAAGIRIRIQVHGSVLPGVLGRHALARALGWDLHGTLRCVEEPEWLEVGMEGLRDLVRLMSIPSPETPRPRGPLFQPCGGS